MEPSPRRASVVLLPLVLFALATPAAARADELSFVPVLRNGGFETGLHPWHARHSALTLVDRAQDQRAALLSLRRSVRGAALYQWPRPVSGTVVGTVYRASASVRSRAGRRLCLRLREVYAGRTVGVARKCLRASRHWRRFAPVLYTARQSGSQLALVVRQPKGRAGDRFVADRITLEQGIQGSDTLPPPDGRPAVGVQFHCGWSSYSDSERTAVADKLAAAGANAVRIDMGWQSLEEAGSGVVSNWYVARMDECIDLAYERGLSVLVTLGWTPGWANGGQGSNVPPTDLGEYARVAGWAAARWAGKVSAWEIWNEPDPVQSYWAADVSRYVELLELAYPAIKDGDPNALVVLGGTSSNDDEWIRQVYSLGAKDYFDVVATHPYQGVGDYPPEHPDDGHRWWFTHVATVRAVMLENGDASKPIWFTEFGWSSHVNWAGIPLWQRGVTDEQQGDYLVRAVDFVQATYPYVTRMFWYKERAEPGGTDVHLEGFALLNSDLTETPAYLALKALLAP